jgi:hypothetical protein
MDTTGNNETISAPSVNEPYQKQAVVAAMDLDWRLRNFASN